MNIDYKIGEQVLRRSDGFDGDERGIVWMFEPPRSSAAYVMSIDPTVGRTGWTRETRTADDYRTDNGAIHMLRVGEGGGSDIQVAEYAAPIDAEDLGVVANAMGRLYGGRDDNGQALCIIEMYPGPGLLTYRKMVNDFGYTNHFVWKYLDSMSVQNTQKFGFWPGRDSNKFLWIRASRHIHSGKYKPRSPWLVEEMRNCAIDPSKMWGSAVYGKHDDRVRAMMMGLWAAHDWSAQIETKDTVIRKADVNEPMWQASDISAEKLAEAWEDRFSELCEAA